MFQAARDVLTSKAAQAFVNKQIERYGEVRMLRIDSRNKSMEVVCHLIGETDPITVRVDHYEVKESAGEKKLVMGSCTCSRPWLQNLLNDYARGREVPVPSWAAGAL